MIETIAIIVTAIVSYAIGRRSKWSEVAYWRELAYDRDEYRGHSRIH